MICVWYDNDISPRFTSSWGPDGPRCRADVKRLYHPFVDGNKRTAFLVLGLWLASEGHVLSPPPEDAVAMFEQVAQGAVDVQELARWARQWCE